MLTRRQYNRKSIGKTEKSASPSICPIGRVGDVHTLLQIKLFLKKDKYGVARMPATRWVLIGRILKKLRESGSKK